MGRGAFEELLEFSEDLCENAGECGHRAFTIMAGALDGMAVAAEPAFLRGAFRRRLRCVRLCALRAGF